MLMEYTCIICPNGCGLEAEIVDGKIRSIKGARCERGRMYNEQELSDPQRNIATSVLVEGGTLPLCSVRLSGPIPKGKIFDVMAEIRAARLTAPVKAGTVVLGNVLGLGRDVIATKNIPAG